MTHLRKMMLEELQRRHYSEATTRRYIRFIERFAQHFHRSPDRLGPQHIREYQAQLFTVRRLAPGSVTNHLCALRFFYIQTLASDSRHLRIEKSSRDQGNSLAALLAIKRKPLLAASFCRAARWARPEVILPDLISISPNSRRASN